MKKMIFAVLPLYLISCGGEATEETEGNETEEVVETCTYTYDPEATILTWTGFKLTEKVGVNGTFDEINVVSNDGSENMYDVLAGATFTIPVESVNSQEPTRDPKLRKNFFGTMSATENITGTINSIDANGASIELVMNEVSVNYDASVETDGETITSTLTINMADFDAQHSIDSLNVVCLEKHTGEDGESKLWSDVDIAVKTTLVKNCK
ncbi:MAG: YceI family protein [Crocinitomicaceae bacterium]|nr:YceI family protein [Crocinitomicaceae bacterium]